LVQVFAVEQLVERVDQTIADGQSFEVDFDFGTGVVLVNGMIHGWHVVAGERFTSYIKIVVLVLGEKLEKLHQGGIHVSGDIRLIGTVTGIVTSVAEACPHRVVHV